MTTEATAQSRLNQYTLDNMTFGAAPNRATRSCGKSVPPILLTGCVVLNHSYQNRLWTVAIVLLSPLLSDSSASSPAGSLAAQGQAQLATPEPVLPVSSLRPGHALRSLSLPR